MNYIYTAYLILINIFSFALMGIDKSQARSGGRRVAEKTLFLSAALGGSPGSILGMYAFRHKTKHPSFKLGLPVILILQVALIYFFA